MAAMEFQDYYKTLGVPRTATPAEIKKAYRKLARENHPDTSPGDAKAEQRFKAINEANAVLTDADKRKRYDALGKDWDKYTSGPGGAGGGPGGDPFGPGGPFAGYARGAPGGESGIRYEFRTSSGDAAGFSDFFRMMFGGGAGEPTQRGRAETATAPGSQSIEDFLASMGGGGGAGAARGAGARPAARLRAAEANADLSLEEAFHGTSRIVEVDGKRLEVTIPRGVDSGSRIKLSGKGGGGRDLVVVTRVRPHPVFTRRGPDLEREIPITLREALLGAEVSVATLKGRVLLNVPAGTQAGRTFRLTGQGMPRFNAAGTGDLYVRVRVVLPGPLDDDARAAATRFLDLVNQPDPRAS